ncbi:RNA polymerase sigma-70 factor [uncultured Parabacteroides sp.]|jgi:RNA polymerase sigma-70 factor (family 1)|uniref:RNA polymerase sigma-70 factor n=1 Tax=uncultured Parabacteroides sp. TaxID=512312 RepID=UPI0025F5F5FA|nr:RNA polymerase sigma-70 factor [uncultured Parabacteroides sp.]
MENEIRNIQHSEDYYWNTTLGSGEKQFKKLFELFYPPLCQYAKRYIEDKAIREDIVQEVFASLWENRMKMTEGISIRAYLVVCTKNQCISYLRREGYMQQYMDLQIRKITSADSGENDIYLLTELQALLDKALSKLPETYRLVFEMNRLEGKSFDEIAETLNISVRTAKRYKSQATDILKEDLKDYLSLVLFLSPSLFN